MTVSLLFLSGSTRAGSFNTKLAKNAAEIAQRLGAKAEFIDLADYPMPLFNQDLEATEGAPETVLALKAKFKAANGFFIATPEYNSSFTPLLKNAIDWISRPTAKDEPMLQCFFNKSAAIAGASPGGFGGLRALDPLRLLLAHIGVNVVGAQLAVPTAHEAFDAEGKLAEDKRGTLENIVKTLIRIS